MNGPRRPRISSLASFYQEGVDGHDKGHPSPYDPPRAAGDIIRHGLWMNGFEDARERAGEAAEIASLI